MNCPFAYYPTMNSVYLDWAATAPVKNDIPLLMTEVLLSANGNPSSLHSEGIKAREVIDKSRKSCAALLKVKPEQLIFTSGGTESNSIVLSSFFRMKSRGHIVISAIEHSSIYEFTSAFKDAGFRYSIIKPDSRGFIDPDSILSVLTPETQMLAVMAVNNETGAIQDLKGIVDRVRSFERLNGRKIHIHTDAVQILGKLPFLPGSVDIDSASFSAHKIGGPKGTGMLYLKKSIVPLSRGGGQEFGVRPGTENTPGILAFTHALDQSINTLDSGLAHAEKLKATLVNQISEIRGARILFNSRQDDIQNYSPYITSITTAPVPGEVVVRVMKDEGFLISTGSACSSKNRKKQMRVLMASGISEKEASGSIRISTGEKTAESDILKFCSVLSSRLSELRKYLK